VASTPLIIAKVLVPRLSPDLLYRPRLVDFLHEHIDRKLILISAAAGYGKTSLLIHYAHATDLPVCWYSLEPSDNAPCLFMEYFIASLRQHFPNIGQRALALLRESSEPALEPAVNLLINEMRDQVHQDVVIILDDYQEVGENPLVNTIVNRLIRYLPDHCHFILASRTLPPLLSLTALSAQRQVAGLGVRELRFTPAEIQALAQRNYHLNLSDEEARALADRSEGWITGILLTTHTLWQGLFQSLARVQGVGGQLFEYLANEVFRGQPEDIQHFLLFTSVLREMSPTLCDALLGIDTSAAMLHRLEARNLFISRLEGPGEWFRYHPLFREFLEQKLRTEFPIRYRQLHRLAGQLHQCERRWDAAIYHYIEAECPNLAAQLVEQIAARMYERGQWCTLTRWIDMLPQQTYDQHPMLKLWRAKVYTELGDLDEALKLLNEAYQGLQEERTFDRRARILVERGNVLRLMGDLTGAIADCQAVLQTSDHVGISTIASAHHVLGACYGLRGEFTESAREFENALYLYRQARDRENEAYVYYDLGVIYQMMGDVSRSLGYLQRALRYWEMADRPWALVSALNSLARNYYYSGRYAEAERIFEEVLYKAREAGYIRVEAHALAGRGDLHRDIGRLDKAIRDYEASLRAAQQIHETRVAVYAMAALGDAYRMQGQWSMAWELLQQALLLAEQHGFRYEVGLCELNLGALSCDTGKLSAARRHLEQAYTLFERGGARRELARAALQLAYLEFISLRKQKALRHLTLALEIVDQTGSDQFLFIDGTRLLPLYRYAVRQKVGLSHLRKVCERLEQVGRAKVAALPAVRMVSQKMHLLAFALGPSRVVKDGHLLERSVWGSVVTRELFFYLLEHRYPLRKEQIVDTFWVGLDEERANSNFHSTVYRLRRAIAQDVLLYEDGLYRLNPELEIWYDVDMFQELIYQARRPDLSLRERERILEEALDLYQGDFLVEFYSDWCVPQREALRRLCLEAILQLGKIKADGDDLEEAAALFESALELDNYREETYMLLMQVCALRGDRDGVSYWYRRCRDALAEELGVKPSNGTTQFYYELVNGL